MANRSIWSVLARAFLAGEADLGQLIARGSHVLGRRWRWLRPVAVQYLRIFAGGIRPRHRQVVQFLLRNTEAGDAQRQYGRQLSIANWLPTPQEMQPTAAVRGWDLPAIASAGALADWLWLEYGELDWFADRKGLAYRSGSGRLGHYRYRLLRKQSGGFRLIEAPKPRLKKLQREILAGILDQIPPHPAAHGFVKGRSIQTFAAPHVGKRVVLRMDLLNFFGCIRSARVETIFRMLGYPETVADLLAGLCTNAVPGNVWLESGHDPDALPLLEAHAPFGRRHLPQGAPTSPGLANVCAYRLDCRLTGLAKEAGAEYTRYADDLAFSGDSRFEERASRFAVMVAAVLLEEGFRARHSKTRVMREGARQHLAGLVVNRKLNVKRKDFDVLKATLTNCVRMGPASQNREQHPEFRRHLEGRVAFVTSVHPERGRRLRSLLERIRW